MADKSAFVRKRIVKLRNNLSNNRTISCHISCVALDGARSNSLWHFVKQTKKFGHPGSGQ
jgi:hypothetical protein